LTLSERRGREGRYVAGIHGRPSVPPSVDRERGERKRERIPLLNFSESMGKEGKRKGVPVDFYLWERKGGIVRYCYSLAFRRNEERGKKKKGESTLLY